MVSILRRLPLFEADADMRREMASIYNELAKLCEDESMMSSFTLRQQRAKRATAEMLRRLALNYDPEVDFVARHNLLKELGRGLVEQSRESLRRSRENPGRSQRVTLN